MRVPALDGATTIRATRPDRAPRMQAMVRGDLDTLGRLPADDYVRHLRHHLEQILGENRMSTQGE